MVRYVERDGDGVVVAEYARPQPGRAQEKLADDHADLIAFRSPPEPDYREKRKRDYAAGRENGGLGVDPDVINTLGDVLDVLIAQTEATRQAAGASATAEYADMLTKIAAIKARHPKGT